MTSQSEEFAVALTVREWFASFNRWHGSLAAVRVIESHAATAQAAEWLAEFRRGPESEIGASWAGFKAFCVELLDADPVEVVIQTEFPLDDVAEYETFEFDWAKAVEHRDELHRVFAAHLETLEDD